MLGCMTSRLPSAGFLFSPAEHPCMTRAVNDRAHLAANVGSADIAALVEAVALGDRGAFATLYQRTSAKLYGICIHLMGNDADAQDILQETFVTVWNKAARFDPAKASAITWLVVLARNKAIDRLRRRTLASENLDTARDVEDDSPSAFDVVGNSQDADRLRRCLEELDERARAAIRSAFLDGHNYPELATREGVPLGTMKSWIRRGLQRLRGCLER